MIIDYSDRKEIGNTGEKVSAIGLGTWGIKDYGTALKAFIHAIELGIDNFDTAEIYDNGKAEEFLGRVVMEVGRERVFITTKLTPYNLSDRYRALKAAESSLKRLGVKTIDLILAHWSESYFKIKDEIKSLEFLLDAGFTRYIGVSNYSIEELEEALASLSKHDIVVDQVRYNVYDKEVEKGLLEYCSKNRITIQAYTPLEHGRVSDDPFLREIGDKYGRTPVQVALNYLISHYYVIAIPKTERIERVDEIYGSLGWRLSNDDLEAIKRR